MFTHSLRGTLITSACAMMLAGTLDSAARVCFAGQVRAQSSVVEQARAALGHGHVDEAIASLKSRLAEHPEDVNAEVMLGDAYRSAREPQQAEAAFKHALKISPGNFAALLELGALYAESGRLDLAEPLLARAARGERRSAPARIAWATVLSKLHRYPKASAVLRGVSAPAASDQRIAYERLRASIDLGLGNAAAAALDMERALRLAPRDAGLQFATGVAENQAGRWSRASELLRPIFENARSPQAGMALLEAEMGARQDYKPTLASVRSAASASQAESQVRVSLAQILIRHGLYAEAANDLARAASLEPGHADLLYDLALAQLRAGEFGDALESAEKARAVEDSASLESLLGEIQEKRGESLAAARSFQSAVELDPQREDYRLSLGLELMSHGTFEAALAVFKQGAELFPQSFRMRVALGLTYYFLEQYSEAIQTILAGTKLGRDPALAYEYLGGIQLEPIVQPDSSAVEQLCAYSDGHPKDVKAEAYCGALQARMARDEGDPPPAGALRRLREAARTAPKDPTARCELGKALDHAHQWNEARAEVEACVRLDPDSVDAHYRLAGLYRRLGQADLATKEMRLHDEAVRRMVQANAERDRTLRKFVVTMRSTTSPRN